MKLMSAPGSLLWTIISACSNATSKTAADSFPGIQTERFLVRGFRLWRVRPQSISRRLPCREAISTVRSVSVKLPGGGHQLSGFVMYVATRTIFFVATSSG